MMISKATFVSMITTIMTAITETRNFHTEHRVNPEFCVNVK